MINMKMIKYLRVSTQEQAGTGYGLGAQEDAINAEASRRGWTLIDIAPDAGYSAASLNRPAIKIALDMLAAGEADGLVVAKLDRLSRSVLDFAQLMATALKGRWTIVVLDAGVDTSTPSGKLMANVMVSFAEYERELIGLRTKEGLAVARSRGVVLGNSKRNGTEVVARIVADRASGMTLTAIAAALTAEGVPTANGGARWYPSTIKGVLDRQAVAA